VSGSPLDLISGLSRFFGEVRYFDFHPAPDARYGVVPVWGFGTVVRSTVTHGKFDIREGEKVYGYFAPTKYLSLPVKEKSVGRYTFNVARPHIPPGWSTLSLNRRK